MNLADLRLSYTKFGLTEQDALPDPFEQFGAWFAQAQQSGNPEPNAMTLATASANGVPNARTVLLKSFGPDGLVFYTNYDSRKGAELSENPRAALLFYWPELERQVRISGAVAIVSSEDSERYFHSRPAGHQLGAWASRQSSVVSGREALERNLADIAKQFEAGIIPLPPFWGGFRVIPSAFEFWQGRPNRLHDRLEYVQGSGEAWTIRRLSP